MELPPLLPFTLQVTAVFATPRTSAVNCCVPPRATDAVDGETVMLAKDVMFTAADAFFVVSAMEAATTLTTAGLGTVAGARYKPLLSRVP